MRKDWIKTLAIVTAVYVLALLAAFCGGCGPVNNSGGTATTQPGGAISAAGQAKLLRLSLLTEANEAYATAENLVADAHLGGLLSDQDTLAAYRGFQQARGWLRLAKSLAGSGSDADFQAALLNFRNSLPKTTGGKGPVGGVIQEEVERFADQRA